MRTASPARRTAMSLFGRIAWMLIAVAATLGMPSVANADTNVGVGIRLADVPVASSENPRARVYIIDHVAPGTLVKRRVEVSNNTGKDAQIEVYSAAADASHGSFVGLADRAQNELSTWTNVDRPTLRLTDGAKKMVEVQIDVPDDAAPGEQYAIIWAQTSGTKDKKGVTRVSRVGIRVYLSVGPGGEPASKFKIESVTAARDAVGDPMVRGTIRNTGGRALDLSGTVRLTEGPGGLSAGPFPLELGTTLGIGETEPVGFKLDKQLPNGPWKAHLKVTSGLLTETAQATITFPESGTAEAVATSDGLGVWLWVGIAALGLFLLALMGWLLARRPRKPRRRSREQGVRAPPRPVLEKVVT